MRYIIIIMTAFFIYGCSENTPSKDEPSVNETEVALDNNIIKIDGSETELHLVESLSEKFYTIDNSHEFSVEGGGSKVGWEDLMNGKIDLANSSEKIDPNIVKKAKKKGVIIKEVIIAMDAVAIITNEKLGIDSLSNFDLGKIFRGEITNWKDVGGPDLPITVYNRDINSGTYGFIWKKLIQDDFAEEGQIVHNNEELLEKVKSDSSGIGYIGLGFITDALGKPVENVWSINVFIEGDQAYTPYEVSQVLEGKYYLTRPLYQYFDENNAEKVMPFINYELSDDGQLDVFQNHFLPISEEYKIRNQMNGIGSELIE